ncbi:hypothetical protein COR50_12135 [Chitinophaga caeni]|uniref:Uncharacterized protein n=1 Tax=Chitinophaga caeni TaxID=2029983 RepID=A0A291QUY8_9BACT|nr:hypothetical protein [Chitinophaga caeni]ATL47849.1 hypothetical protein COR50_12135 [Chitinophaga caeni]
MSQEKLLYIVLGVGAAFLIFITVKDLIKKPKNLVDKDTDTAKASAGSHSQVLSLKLQAYERMVLLVDRLTPQNLISRLYTSGMTVNDMHQVLVHTIKTEFEHNITQQIYVSAASWDAVKTMKDQTIALIHHVAASFPGDAPALELNKKLLELFSQTQDGATASDIVSSILNDEAKKIMV